MSQYVLLRITTLTGIDLNLFEFDRHNALFFFVMNADEHIYMRFGGRDERSATTYLNFDSLNLALTQGLEQHELYEQGKLPKQIRKDPFYPRDIPTLKRDVIDKKRCVECHLVGDHRATQKETEGSLDKLKDMFVYPDIRNLGFELDIPKGLKVAKVTASAKVSGMLPGDLVTELNNKKVFTFADIQHLLNTVDRQAKKIQISVQRKGKTVPLKLTLPDQWWLTDLTHRYWSIDPLVFFKAQKLSDEEKQKLNLPLDGFASKITELDINAMLEGAHDLEEGDIVVSVNKVQKDAVTQDLITHIKLHHRAGSSTSLGVIRSGKLQEMTLKTKQQQYRK